MRKVAAICLILFVSLTVEAQTVEWAFELPAGTPAAVLYPGTEAPTGVVAGSKDLLVRLDGAGKAVWQAALQPEASTAPTVADLDGNGRVDIILGLLDGTVACFEEDAAGRSVSERWRYAFETPSSTFTTLAASDLTPEPGLELVFGFNDGWMNCLSADGKLLWRFFGDRFRVGPPAVGDTDGDGRPEVVYGTDNGHVYCLSGTGEPEWRYSEMAPYGRSGVNIADLDGDGVAEILITRSNVGLDRCLMALDGRDGTFKWRTQDVMQGYVSNAIVRFEKGQPACVLHADKGNHLYATNADGTERWRVALAGHGIFWAPAAADVDGDGGIETIVGVRDSDPETGACLYVVGPDGKVEHALDIGGDSNSSPAVGDIDNDGELEVIVVTMRPNQVQALTWNAPGRVEWPSVRGDSRMTAATNVPPGTPGEPVRPDAPAELRLSGAPERWGDATCQAAWDEAVGGDAFTVTCYRPGPSASLGSDAAVEYRVTDLREGQSQADVAWTTVSSQGVVDVAVMSAHQGPIASQAFPVRAGMPEDYGQAGFEQSLAEVLETANEHGADISGLTAARLRIEGLSEAIRMRREAGAPPRELAGMATEMHRDGEFLADFAAALKHHWQAGGTAPFLAWVDDNPWDKFDPRAIPERLTSAAPDETVRMKGFVNETEDAAVTLLNATAEPLEVRCMFAPPNLGQGLPNEAPELADHITLRRLVPVSSWSNQRVFDALPELDASHAITLPPGEARQVWLCADTRNVAPGEHAATLHLGVLAGAPEIVEVPLELSVWPISLPRDVFAKINWSVIHPERRSGQAVQDMLDHGISCVYGPSLPAIPVDAEGNLAGTIDWTVFDTTLERVPGYFYMLWGAPPPRKWPEGVNPAPDSEAYFNGFKTAVLELGRHLEEKGIRYDQWAFYPIDEPWLTGFSHIPHLRRFCQMVKRSDPRVQNYTDPAGLVRVEYIDEFKDLIDIWQPELNLLKRDPELVQWFRDNARHFWTYHAIGPGKDLPPMGHYRLYAWIAWHFGCEGAGYWVYARNDIWWPVQGGDWSVGYQTGDQVVPSRRWEADRDGVEDYRAFSVLREESRRARGLGLDEAADSAQKLLDDAMQDMVAWNIENIDEITSYTRDFDLPLNRFLEWRDRVADKILELRRLIAQAAPPELEG